VVGQEASDCLLRRGLHISTNPLAVVVAAAMPLESAVLAALVGFRQAVVVVVEAAQLAGVQAVLVPQAAL
jgi:hypothetical protein